eukprot:1508699-Rhodomonas_salina.1
MRCALPPPALLAQRSCVSSEREAPKLFPESGVVLALLMRCQGLSQGGRVTTCAKSLACCEGHQRGLHGSIRRAEKAE